jgi:hypothetical protein
MMVHVVFTMDDGVPVIHKIFSRAEAAQIFVFLQNGKNRTYWYDSYPLDTE